MKQNEIKLAISKSENDLKRFICDYNLNVNNGSITIDLTDCNIYQPYSNNMLLDSNIYDYINQIYRVLNAKKIKLQINIKYPDDMPNEERIKIKRLLEIHYATRFKENTYSIRHTNTKGLILLLIGSFFLALYALFNYKSLNFILCSVVEIFAWVFVWESCNCFFLVNTSNRFERIRNLNIYNSLSKIE